MSVGPAALLIGMPVSGEDVGLPAALLAWNYTPLWNPGQCLHPSSLQSLANLSKIV